MGCGCSLYTEISMNGLKVSRHCLTQCHLPTITPSLSLSIAIPKAGCVFQSLQQVTSSPYMAITCGSEPLIDLLESLKTNQLLTSDVVQKLFIIIQ